MADTAAPAALASPQISGRATDLLDLMIRLGALLAHESELVRSGHVRDIEPLQREKLRLFGLYNKAIKEFEAAGLKFSALSPPLRAQFVAASATLTERVAENERTLRVGREATRRLLDMVVASMKHRLKPLSCYDARRKVQPARMVPCAVDRRL